VTREANIIHETRLKSEVSKPQHALVGVVLESEFGWMIIILSMCLLQCNKCIDGNDMIEELIIISQDKDDNNHEYNTMMDRGMLRCGMTPLAVYQ
jgi:uncharacterized protein YjfI (DUF2170 family)